MTLHDGAQVGIATAWSLRLYIVDCKGSGCKDLGSDQDTTVNAVDLSLAS